MTPEPGFGLLAYDGFHDRIETLRIEPDISCLVSGAQDFDRREELDFIAAIARRREISWQYRHIEAERKERNARRSGCRDSEQVSKDALLVWVRILIHQNSDVAGSLQCLEDMARSVLLRYHTVSCGLPYFPQIALKLGVVQRTRYKAERVAMERVRNGQ